MAGMLTSLTGKFRYSFLIGAFVPAILFIVLVRSLLFPLLPEIISQTFFESTQVSDILGELVAFLLLVIVIALILSNLNSPIIRLYEGYPWQYTHLGQWKIKRYKKKFDALHAQYTGWPKLYETLNKQLTECQNRSPMTDADRAQIHAITEQMKAIRSNGNKAARAINQDFPKRISILPTELGNLIRSFENYPARQYKMAGVTLTPLLMAVVDDSYAKVLDETKARLDFMLNGSILSLLLFVLLAVTGLSYGLDSFRTWWVWIIELLLLLLLATWLYRQSITAARSWGTVVRGAFDLYRNDLLKKLGYTYELTTASEERNIWNKISNRFAYGDPPPGRGILLPYKPDTVPPLPRTHALDENGNQLQILRVLSCHGDQTIFIVQIQVQNINPDRIVKGIDITDTIPEGFYLDLDSVTCDRGHVEISGINPYKFHFGGNLAGSSTLRLTYATKLFPLDQKTHPEVKMRSRTSEKQGFLHRIISRGR